MKPLHDFGVELLRAQEADAKARCQACNSNPPADHHHHFCLGCGRVLTLEEEQAHRAAISSPTPAPEAEEHEIQFCIECAPPAALDATSTVSRYAEKLYEYFAHALPGILEAERLLYSEISRKGSERIVPRETWPTIRDDEETLPGIRFRIDKGLRLALQPLAFMPSTVLEKFGPRVLLHPLIWKAVIGLAAMAAEEDSRAEAARHEIRTLAALLARDRKPQQSLGRDFDKRLLAEFERLRDNGATAARAYAELTSRTGLTALNLQKRVSRERDRTKKRRLPYVERKGPAKGVRRS